MNPLKYSKKYLRGCYVYTSYYYTTISTASTSNYVYQHLIQETFTYKRTACPDIEIFPFKVKHEIVETIGSVDYYSKKHSYTAMDGGRWIDTFSELEEISIEKLEEILSKEGQKWLGKEMRSTMKVD
jgi:C1A family cysteine protease